MSMSRRQEALRIKPSNMTSRDRRNGPGHDPYMTFRGGPREEQPLRSRRNFSPPEGNRRTMGRDRQSSSLERWRGYEYQVGRAHVDDVLPSSPPVDHVRKRPQLDERTFHLSSTSTEINRKYEYPEYVNRNDMNSRSKYPVSYDERFQFSKEEDFIGRRSGSSAHRSMPIEGDMDREVQLHTNYVSTSRYGEASSSYSAVDVHRFKDENTQYQDAIAYENLSKDIYCKDKEKYAYYSGGSPYLESPVSELKDLESEDFQKCGPGTSSGIAARGVYSSKVRDAHTSPSDGYSRNYMRGIESRIGDDYDPRTVSDPRRGYESGVMDAKCSCDAYASAKSGYNDNYPEIGLRIIDVPRYTHGGNLPTKMAYVHEEHDRSPVRPNFVDATAECIRESEDSHFTRRTNKNSGVRELQKEMAQGYMDMRRSTNEPKQAGDYSDDGYTHVEFTKKVSNHQHTTEFCGSQDHEIEDPRLSYDYGRCAPSRSDGTRIKTLPELKTDIELQRNVVSRRMEVVVPVVYERTLKRKYSMDNDMSRVDSKSVIPSKYYTSTRHYDYDDYQVEWTSGKSVAGRSSRPSKYDQNNYYTEAEQMSDKIYHHANVGWTSFLNQSDNMQEDSGKPIKLRCRASKGYPKSDSSKHYSHMHHSHQRSNQYKQLNLGQRNGDDNLMTRHAQDIDLPEDTSDPWKGEPSEESEGFKQKVQAAFLDFSKRFNENPTARKLYKEQGKAGSLFCVVCRRSASKEFLDTRALATHAFMSQKPGSRPLHLGLHKAICVLMGWNIMPDCDSGTWIPEALPRSEALVQKEDLILWPPLVIIHNISLSSNDHNEWKLINIEALGDFLRAKGFSLGKMKICIGNPGDHSVILVKFLSTFSGLQEAERLHKHFLDRKHGRLHFDQAISNIGKISVVSQGSNQAENQLEDELLYGYMGIAEDLDKVDFDTKKKCSVKSKKEIHDLADAPVKPECQ